LCIAIALLLVCVDVATSVTQTFVADDNYDNLIANPERGFYNHEETTINNYDALSLTHLKNLYSTKKVTLILRIIYLTGYAAKATLPSSFLNNLLPDDFDTIRQAGMKALIRFTYTDKSTKPYGDAAPAIVMSHLDQLAPILQANVDVIQAFQVGFVGAWGEWYYTDYYGDQGRVTAQNQIDRDALVNALLDIFPSSRMIQIRTPALKRANTGVNAAITSFDNSQATSRIAHHDDCFLAPNLDEGTYVNAADKQWAFTETKYLMWGGENCVTNPPQTLCPSAKTNLESLHATYLNINHLEILNSWKSGGCYNEIHSRFGYRLALKSASATANGLALSGYFKFKNTGYSAPVNPRELVMVVSSVADPSIKASFVIASSLDTASSSSNGKNIRAWFPSTTTKPLITVSFSETLPSTFANVASVKFNLHLRDPMLRNRYEYSIRLANVQTSVKFNTNNGYNSLLGFTLAL